MFVMPGYKANAKNTNTGVSAGVGEVFNLGRGRPAKEKIIRSKGIMINFIESGAGLPLPNPS
jgi:hypothetical protein